MWVYYQPNPCGRSVKDCAVRAITLALNVDWDTAYDILATNGRKMCDMPDSDSVWGAVLRMHGFRKEIVPNTCPTCYTVKQFAYDNPEGIFIIGLGGHVTTVVDGIIYDSWNTSNEIPIYVWKEDKGGLI